MTKCCSIVWLSDILFLHTRCKKYKFQKCVAQLNQIWSICCTLGVTTEIWDFKFRVYRKNTIQFGDKKWHFCLKWYFRSTLGSGSPEDRGSRIRSQKRKKLQVSTLLSENRDDGVCTHCTRKRFARCWSLINNSQLFKRRITMEINTNSIDHSSPFTLQKRQWHLQFSMYF